MAVTYSNWIEDPSERAKRNMANKGYAVEKEADIFVLVESAPMGKEIAETFYELMELMLLKNIAYGNSLFEPLRIFSKADAAEGARVRIDDKLSRFARGSEYPGDNDVNDLINYLVALKIAEK